MKQQTPLKDSSIAWYKLAELINRGEKEKVLSLYQLLAHSFEDKAYALQVEGDILWSFEDRAAVTKYQQAAHLYKKDQKMVSAVGIFEHLFTLEPHNSEFLMALLELYVHLDWPEKWRERSDVLFTWYKEHKVPRASLEKHLISLIKQVQNSGTIQPRLITEQYLFDQLTLQNSEFAQYLKQATKRNG